MGFTVESMTAARPPYSLSFRHLKDINQCNFWLFRKGSVSFRCFKLCASCRWGAVNNSQIVKIGGEIVRQVREPSKGFELKHSFHMQETEALS